jgi:L-alanine-DL-glutamate epimerase-like enolase superfamily enzyme
MLASDANQGWTVEQALRASASMPLAAGENIASREYFEQVLSEDVLGVVQPDIASGAGSPFVPDWRATSSRPARRFVRTISAAALAC